MASLDLTFYDGDQFPKEYRHDAFAAEHGSWNRARRTGYKVIRVPMKDGKATGEYEDFLSASSPRRATSGAARSGVAVAKDGSLMVTDDGGNRSGESLVEHERLSGSLCARLTVLPRARSAQPGALRCRGRSN